MTRRDSEQRPDGRTLWGLWRRLDLIHDGQTFLRRRGFDLRHLGGILVHRIDGPDPGLDVHDHPWSFVSIVLRGAYTEEAIDIRDASRWATYAEMMEREYPSQHILRGMQRTWRRGSVHRMPLTIAHRITACEPGTVTLVLRRRKVRSWGFYLPLGWQDWRDYDYDTRRPSAAVSNMANENQTQAG